jgi:hypothetical protein
MVISCLVFCPTLYASRQIWFLLPLAACSAGYGKGQQHSPIMIDNYPVDACAGEGDIRFKIAAERGHGRA